MALLQYTIFTLVLVAIPMTTAQYQALLCEGDGRLPLSCPAGQVLEINDAFYGRENLKTCPNDLAYQPQTICSAARALEVVNTTCRGLPRCELLARDAVFGQPCVVDNYSYLRVNYSCRDCVNLQDDYDCEKWSLDGQCTSNPIWMYNNCRATCLSCNRTMPSCTNLSPDVDCDAWADDGDCVQGGFTTWMNFNCRKSCLRCDKPATCMDASLGDGNETCTSWKADGQCWRNPAFMLRNCAGTCLCSNTARYTARVQCTNRHPGTDPDAEDNDPDAECRNWVAQGACTTNPGFMWPMCFKACSNCTGTPVCENSYVDGAQCARFADDGECAANPLWMLTNCYQACTSCQPEPVCENKHVDDVDCERWRDEGRCANATLLEEDMYQQCWATCSRCKPKRVPGCDNKADDDDCERWRDQDSQECGANPNWMLTNCRKSCTFCDSRRYTESYLLGNYPIPGESLMMTRGRTFVMGDTMRGYGSLTSFIVFFSSRANVTLGVWRWIEDQNTADVRTLTRVFSQVVQPMGVGVSQTISAEGECFDLSQGDRIGFSGPEDEPSPIAFRFTPANVATFDFKIPKTNDRFHSMNLPYAFSLAATFDPVRICPPLNYYY